MRLGLILLKEKMGQLVKTAPMVKMVLMEKMEKDGNTVLSGKGSPSKTTGKDGDFYIDTVSFDCYTKSDGKWTITGNIKGEKGDKGDTGLTGPQGDKGDTGLTGPQGEKGDKGDTGLTGPQGEKGDKGDKGDPGKDAITYIPAIFNNYDGTKLYEFYYEKGTDIVYDGPIPTKTGKDSSGNTLEYTFIGWDKPLTNILKPTIFTAQFEIAKCNVTFLNYDDSVLYTASIPCGSTPEYLGTIPTKPFTETNDVRTNWEFKGWDKELSSIRNDTTYKATFNSYESYKCTFTNEDGTLLGSSYCKAGGTANYVGEEPAKDYVNNKGTITLYKFKSWDKLVTNIKAPTTFVAQYETSTAYECKFVNDDGTLLYSTIVPQGGEAKYVGEVPFKEGIVNGTDITRYKFTGWDRVLTGIYSPVTFTAQFSSEKITGYKVTFANSDGTEICHDYVATDQNAIYPRNYNKFDWSYDKNSVTMFGGWDKDLTNITADTIFKAKFVTISRHQNGEYDYSYVEDEALFNELEKITKPDSDGYYVYDSERYKKLRLPVAYDDQGEYIYGNFYRKIEPIRWRYLSQKGDNVQYLSEYILCEYTWKDTSTLTSGLKLNNYKESDVRKWLNGEFLNTAFYYDSSLIQTTEVDNSVSSTKDYSNSNICANTNDKIYLLSRSDVFNEKYGFTDDESRIAYLNGRKTDWWTRSPDNSTKGNGAYAVTGKGKSNTGLYTGNELGIRPALTFKFN